MLSATVERVAKDSGIDIVLLILSLLALATGVYFSVVLARIVRADLTLPTARTGLRLPEPPDGWPSLCIVIPAHNEEDVIGDLVRSLVVQDYPDLRVVLALDRCTDDTERIAREVITGEDGQADPRFEIIPVHDCPESWAGKVHAVHEGVTRSGGTKDAQLLLFTDADTIFDPRLCRASTALLHSRNLGLLSLLSQLTNKHWYELLVQPAAAFELIREYPLDVINRADRPRAFANGQFMLFRRELYDALGGHALVHDRLLEDLAFAREINRRRDELSNAAWGVFFSAGMLRCHMYRSWEAFKRGWKRIFTEAAGRRPSHLRKWSSRQRVTGTILPLASACAVVLGTISAIVGGPSPPVVLSIVVGVFSTCVFLATCLRVFGIQGIAPVWALTYPIGAWISGGIQRAAGKDLGRGRSTVWAGREYAREART